MPDATADALVREVIASHRGEGLDRAFAAAARLFGIAARRARAYWHHEITDPRESEVRRIRAAYARWADLELRRLDAQREMLLARRDALWGSHDTTGHDDAAASAAPRLAPPARALGCDHAPAGAAR